MNTRKYDKIARKNLKRAQRSPAYQTQRKALAAKRAEIDAQLNELKKTKPTKATDADSEDTQQKWAAYVAAKNKLVAQLGSIGSVTASN